MAVNDLITFRKGIASEWISANPVLASGEPGYDLTNSILKIGDGVSNWAALSGIGSTSVGGGSSSTSVRGNVIATGTLSSFNISGGYTAGYLDLFQNGVKLLSGSDFTATDGTSVILSNSVPSGTILEYASLGASVSSSNYTKLDNISSSFNGSSTSFGLAVSGTVYYPVSANTLGIYVGGVAQEPIFSYSVSGSNIIFTEAPASGLTFWGVGYGTTAVATLNGIAPGSSGSPAISSSNDLTSGFYFPSSGNISVAGNLGIGTSSPSTLLDINNNKFRVRNSKTPSSDTDTGNTGDICWDSNYIYVCTATNSWARSSISRWYSLPSITGLQLWLDAADAATLYDATTGGSLVAANGGVARWEDKSGNGRHFSQSDSSKRPQRKTAQQNGFDSLLFDGTNDSLTGSDFLDGDVGGTTVFVVLKRNATGELHEILTKGTTNGGWVFRITNTNKLNAGAWADASLAGYTDVSSSETVTATGYTAFAWRHTAGSFHTQQFFRNGISVAVDSPVEAGPGSRTLPNTSDVMRIGVQRYDGALAAPGDYFLYNGNIAEIILYNVALSDTDRSAVEQYLISKWGII